MAGVHKVLEAQSGSLSRCGFGAAMSSDEPVQTCPAGYAGTMRTRQLSYAAGFALCCLAVVMVPYLFPPRSGISVSVMAGFSNRAAQVVLLAGGLLFALWTRGWGLRLPDAEDTPGGRRLWVVPAAASVLVGAASLYLWHWASNMGPYDEGIYFLDRFSNQLAGGQVYRDFNFDYGPLLYYPSWWLAAVLHMPVGHAYYLFCLLEWVAGVLLLWDVIGRLRSRRWDRVFTFSVLVLAWLTSITDQGAQYTPLRFVMSSACALWVHRLWQRGARKKTRAALLPAMAAAGLCFIGLLLYSPEQGIGFLAATVLFFAAGVRRREVAVPLAGSRCFLLRFSRWQRTWGGWACCSPLPGARSTCRCCWGLKRCS